MALDGVKQWSLFVKPIRQVIADYAMAIAIIIFAGLSYAGKLEESNMPRLDVPHQFQTTTGRGWYALQRAEAMQALQPKYDSSVSFRWLVRAGSFTSGNCPRRASSWRLVPASSSPFSSSSITTSPRSSRRSASSTSRSRQPTTGTSSSLASQVGLPSTALQCAAHV